ncbi:hypothetical protein CAPTEDRAFT_223047 [Capitella teleta]|uniref:G-protein coupled receptors family 1 profile domain-containing protein n=1 Tax=Capitella teleta TaxID=283909 RepID=R7TWF4_CAPTE|nr:hypothetical protein CAPTEDRAFT_223047 [Capitella teleta]|eukprot:ELT97917.1 hypothetical protein CAPTEDRAFT_223047 [Capitella teleta]
MELSMDFFPTPVGHSRDEISSPGWGDVENGTMSAVLEPPDPIRASADRIRLVFAFLTVLLATVGNSLSLAVMCHRTMRGTSAATYLAAIAAADTFAVYFGQLPVIAKHFSDDIANLATQWQCSGRYFCLYTTGDVAVWLVLALTVDRFVAVRLPHRAKQLCTVTRASVVCLLLTILATLKNVSILFAYTVDTDAGGRGTCSFLPALKHYMIFVRPWVAFTLYTLIPISSVFVLNLLIIQRLISVHRATKGSRSSNFAQSSLTAMFLSVSIVFVVLLTPAMLNHATRAYREETSLSYLITAILDSCSYLNHSVNFFLYCLTGRRFRAVFVAMVSGCCGRHVPEEKMSRTTTNADVAHSATNLS